MPMWSLSERGMYWVSTPTSWTPELTQFERVKSMIRYFPAKGLPLGAPFRQHTETAASAAGKNDRYNAHGANSFGP